MFRTHWLHDLFGLTGSRNRLRQVERGHRSVRLMVEQLEGRITPTGPTLTTLASFTGESGPVGLVTDSNGNLYGTTEYGGAYSSGSIFELTKGSNATTTLASFSGGYGTVPSARLVMDSSVNLYGTTEGGTDHIYGSVFELTHHSSLTTLASFSSGSGGASPCAGVVMDGSGNLYGTTTEGGASGVGTIFELAKGSNTITTLASFNISNGANASPSTGLVIDSNGNLYGTTEYGGADGDGTVFELAKGSNTITTLASFNTSNGSYPSGLIIDGSGNLYGITLDGGADGDGTVFELAKGSNTITTLASFNISGGAYAGMYAGLVMDGNGNLYGTTYYGGDYSNSLGHSDGTVFEVAKGSNTATTLASFNGSNGEYPDGSLVIDNNGNLYGTTILGGSGGSSVGGGTIFELQGVSSTAIAPTITIQPANQTVTAGNGVSFTASASGVPAPTVQWQVSTDGGKSFTDLSGATSTTLTLNQVTTAMNGYEYEAVFTNSIGSITTTAATLTVQTAPPNITSGNSTTFTTGQGNSFLVTATGAPLPTLTESGALPSGVTFTDNGNGTATLMGTPSAGTQGKYYFTVTAHNGIGSDFTQSFTLTVSPAPVPLLPPSPPPFVPPALNVPSLLALFNGLLGDTEMVNTNGTETVTDSLFGIPLIVATYDRSGEFVSADLLGTAIPNWVWLL